MSSYLTTLMQRILPGGTQAVSTEYADRLADYEVWDGYFDNTIYRRITDGGHRDLINLSLGRPSDADIGGLYNPVSEVVNLYKHVFGGDFGTDILARADNNLVTDPLPGDGPRALSPLDLIWRWSNINQRKKELCEFAAKTGNCGLRIVAETGNPDPRRRRVWIKPEHPRIIRDVEYDDRGNVEQILLEYDDCSGLDEQQKVVRIRELLTRDATTRWYVEHGQRAGTPFEVLPNELGVTPYVLLAHQPGPGKWGRNAFYRATDQINRLNKLASHLAEQIDMHVRVTWLVAAQGAAPERFDFSGLSVLYVNTSGGASPPLMEPMVAQLDLAGALAYYQQTVEQVEDKLPELKAIGGRFLSGQSGETIMQLRKPAEDCIADARPFYEDAMVRAENICLSFGVLNDMWDLGTGMGTREAADRAFHGGYEDHSYLPRELLPVSEMEQLAIVEAKQRAGLSRQRALASLGMTETEIQENEAERRREMTGA